MKQKSGKNILLIGVGGTGSKAVDLLYKKIEHFRQTNGNNISAIVFDTDVGSINEITNAKAIPLADNASVGTIVDRVGKEYIKEWFPIEDAAIRSQEMIRGASQWRKKSYLAFLNLMNKPKSRATFTNVLESMTKDPNAACEVYVISSLAGGTGSGSFIPIALYTKRYLRKTLGKNPIVNAMICLPDIFADSQTPENKIKVYANAYAILRELNAINLVARGYNDGHSSKKKSQIKMRIGHPNEPNVGVLFDSLDSQYWTPEAAPFSQIFVMDKIPCVTSVDAHTIVLADSLYSIICTDIGAQFDSEFSNHEIVRSQTNGSNAIYASVSTSQVRFPKETIKNYLAYKKTEAACQDEWLKLHSVVEGKVKEAREEAAQLRRRFTLNTEKYAKFYFEALDDDRENNEGKINEIVDRGTAIFDKETGKKVQGENTVTKYFEDLQKVLNEKISTNPELDVKQKVREAVANVASEVPQKKKGLARKIASMKKYEDVIEENAKFEEAMTGVNEVLKQCYINCIEVINATKSSTCEAILTFDTKRKDLLGNKRLSLVYNVLMKDGSYLHPVTAMVQLCRLYKAIQDEMGPSNLEEWKDLKRQEIEYIPEDILNKLAELDGDKYSQYSQMGKNRFLSFEEKKESYLTTYSDVNADLEQLENDGITLATEITRQASAQLKKIVYDRLLKNIELLINKYRTFFSKFEKERVSLVEEAKLIREKDAGTLDSIINVFSSGDEKDSILRELNADGGFASEADLIEADNIAGQGVFETVFASAKAERMGTSFNEDDTSPFKNLFKKMVDCYRVFVGNSEYFREVETYNVIEAVAAKYDGDVKEAVGELSSIFTTALERATPSLKVDTTENCKDQVNPSDVVVFMMTSDTAEYIKKNAKALGLNVPAGSSELANNVTYACAEQFVKKFSGRDSTRLCLVKKAENSVIYVTGETMDISPLRIAKFDEVGADNLYFRQYSEAIKRWNKYKTDMWNPHIGNDFHKRGNLPYMNEEMEELGDVKLVKAIMYSLNREKVNLQKASVIDPNTFIFKHITEDGKKETIKTTDGKTIDEKSIALLFSWYRNLDDEVIENWANEFDKIVADDIESLPTPSNSEDCGPLERSITNSIFMTMLTKCLFEVKKPNSSTKYSIFDFAWKVHTSEEIIHDNDDAERILRVANSTFLALCKAKAENDMDLFQQVYTHELKNVVYKYVADGMSFVKGEGADKGNIEARKSRLTAVTENLYYANAFRGFNPSTTADSITDDSFTEKIELKPYFDEYEKAAKEAREAEEAKAREDAERAAEEAKLARMEAREAKKAEKEAAGEAVKSGRGRPAKAK